MLPKVKDRAITYSLLAHIRNTGTLAKGPIDIFIPLIKRILSIMNRNGIFEGKSILEIKTVADSYYSIDFPVPVLRKILEEIKKEVNTPELTSFELYHDGAFSINKYTFVEYDETIKQQALEIANIEKLFLKFCGSLSINLEHKDSIFKFIEKNKLSLSKYLSHNDYKNGEEYTIEAQFIEFFKKIPTVYNQIKKIYLGSILASYIEYDIDPTPQDIELLLDTNFIVALLDLNTPESTHTCNTLIKIAKLHDNQIRILSDTIEETKNLLKAKSDNFDSSFLQKKVYPEDIYNACDRRNLNKADLEKIADDLETIIAELGILVIHDTSKLQNEAKFTDEYKSLLNFRNSKKAALHDAMAILYIKKLRGKRIKNFDKVNCWFVNNAVSRDGVSTFSYNGYQSEIIKADDLLNLLWLSNPLTNKSITSEDLADIGLTSIISLTLNKDLPKTKILRELDDNIHKYAQEELKDIDILRIATRITSKQLRNIEELNELANTDKTEFVKRLEEEAEKQKDLDAIRIKKLEDIMEEASLTKDKLNQAKLDIESKSKEMDSKLNSILGEDNSKNAYINNLETELEKIKKLRKNEILNKKIRKWKIKSFIPLIICLVILSLGTFYFLKQADYNFIIAKQEFLKFQDNILAYIFMGSGALLFPFASKVIYDRFFNYSNIENYKKTIDTDL